MSWKMESFPGGQRGVRRGVRAEAPGDPVGLQAVAGGEGEGGAG